MRRLRNILICVLILGLWIPGYGNPSPKVVQITVDNGLINGNVHQIVQDREGFVWIATENGLVRYDGFYYKNYQSKPNYIHSISHNFVNSVNTFDGLHIWIGTMSGLDCYNPISGEFEHYHFYNQLGSVNMKPALRVFPIADGCYVQTDDKYVYYAEKGSDTLRSIVSTKIESNSFVSSIALVDDNLLVVGTKDGQVYKLSNDGSISFLARNKAAVTVVKMIGENQVCVCYADGLIELYKNDTLQESHRLRNIEDTFINDVEIVGDSVLWFGMRSLGIYEMQIGNEPKPVEIPHLINKNCNSVFKDCFGNIWIGHSFGGVTLRLAQTFDLDDGGFLAEHLKNQKVLAILRDGQKTYAGTDGGGLFVYDEQTKRMKNYTYESGIQGILFDNVVTALAADNDYIWVGTYTNGVFALSKKTGSLAFQKQLPQISAKDISSLFVDSQGNVWIGTYENGVFVFNKEQAEFVRHYTGYEGDGFLTISCNGTTCFFEDTNKNLWIGSYYGISRIMPNGTASIYRFDDYPGMRSSVVTSISQSNDGTVWFGSLQGLSFYNEKLDTIVALANVQAANNTAVCGIVPQEDSTMMLITPKYLYVFDSRKNNFQLVSSLNKGEMRRNSFSVNQQSLLLGTDNGVMSVTLPVMASADTSHLLRLTDIMVHGESIFSPKYEYDIYFEDGVYYLNLPYSVKDLSFKFSDFYFDGTYPVDYLYRLKGLNDNWFLLHNDNEVTYTNLQGGDYVFFVKHLTNSSDAEIELHIHIKKAIWEHTWFYVSLILLVIAIICYVFIRRMQRIVRMRNILRKQVALRMQDIKRKTEQIELQNVQMKLQRDAATRQRSEAEQQRAGLEKRLSILLAKIQKNDDLIHDLKQRTVSLNKDKLLLKRKVDLYENNVRDVVFKILLPSEKVEYVSPSVLQLTGYENTEFEEGEVSFKDLLPADIRKNMKSYRSTLLEGKMPEIVDYKIVTKDGVIRTVRQFSRYETNLKGTVIAIEFLLVLIAEERNSKNLVEKRVESDKVAEKEFVEEPTVEVYDWSDKVLLVGDFDENSFKFIQESLLPTKITLIRAVDGEDVLSKYNQNKEKIHVILLDMQLPKLNGFEVACAIRKQNKTIPIIAQTLYGSYDAKLQCFDAGCDSYIAKPYKASDLQEMLLKCLDR
ncbi:MAG: response regulator [Bacteroidales bacterium]|nr:response regulator [Bacteroidales bacterium]